MRFHPAASATTHACIQIAVAFAIICVVTACTESRNATSGDDASLVSLDTRFSRNAFAISATDSSLNVGDTSRIRVPGAGLTASDRSTRVNVRFRSTDTTIVSVDAHGLMRAVRAGSATVFVRTLLGLGGIRMTVVATDAASTTDSAATQAPAAPVIRIHRRQSQRCPSRHRWSHRHRPSSRHRLSRRPTRERCHHSWQHNCPRRQSTSPPPPRRRARCESRQVTPARCRRRSMPPSAVTRSCCPTVRYSVARFISRIGPVAVRSFCGPQPFPQQHAHA